MPRSNTASANAAKLSVSEPAVLILASLSAQDKHGYAIILDIETHTGRRLGPGTLYGAIARLEALGYIKALPAEDRGRVPYRITLSGKRALQERMAELDRYRSVLRGLATS